jgi:hypothetical protein
MDTILIDSSFVNLFAAIRELEYGELRPDTIVKTGQKLGAGRLINEEVRLMAAIEQHGTPGVIKVVAGRPIFATFSVQTCAGPATKTEKFN